MCIFFNRKINFYYFLFVIGKIHLMQIYRIYNKLQAHLRRQYVIHYCHMESIFFLEISRENKIYERGPVPEDITGDYLSSVPCCFLTYWRHCCFRG